MAPERNGPQNKFALHRTVRTPYDRKGTNRAGSNAGSGASKPQARASTLSSISQSVMRAFGTLWHTSRDSDASASIAEPSVEIGHSFAHHSAPRTSANTPALDTSSLGSASTADGSVDLSIKQRKILAYRRALKQMAPIKRRRSDISETSEDARGEQTQDVTALSVAAIPRTTASRHHHNEPSDVGQETVTEVTETTLGNATRDHTRNDTRSDSKLSPPAKAAKHRRNDTATTTSPRKPQWQARSFNSRLGRSEPARPERRLELVTEPLIDIDKLVASGRDVKGLFSANFELSDESDDDGPPTPKASAKTPSLSRRPAIESTRVDEQRRLTAATPSTSQSTSSSPPFKTALKNPPQYSFSEPADKAPEPVSLKSDAPVFSFKPDAKSAETPEKPTDKPADKPVFGKAPALPSSSSGFSFGAQKDLPAPSTASEAPKPAEKPGFSFGASDKPAEKPAFSFGAAKPADSPAQPARPAQPAEKPAFSFGAKPADKPAETEKPAEKPAEKAFQFGSGDKPSFSFSASQTEAKPAESPAKPEETPAKPAFSFGSSAAKPLFGDASAKPAADLFGSASKPAEKKPEDKPAFSFGSGASKPGFSFGSSSQTEPASAPPSGGFQFGKPDAPATTTAATTPAAATPAAGTAPATPSTGFQFGKPAEPAKPADSAADKPSGFTFGKPAESKETTPSAGFAFGKPAEPEKKEGTPQFGASTDKPAASPFQFGKPVDAKPATPSTGFQFGSSAAATPAPSVGTPSGFSFGANSAAPAPAAGAASASPFQFGASAAGSTQPESNKRSHFAGSEPPTSKPAFQFGSSATPAAGAGAAGSTAPAKPFAFGANGTGGSSGAPANGFSFGSNGSAASPGFGQPAASKPNFMFGSSAGAASASPSPQPETPTAGFGFGQNGSGASGGFGASAPSSGFSFGSNTTGGSAGGPNGFNATPAAGNGFAFGSNPTASAGNAFGSGAGPAANNPFAVGVGGGRVSAANGRPVASPRRRMR